MTELVVERLCYARSGRVYLAAVDLELPAGAVLALQASPPATGRYLLQLLSGLLAPSEGDARLAGVSLLADRWAFRRQVGYMPADFGVYPRITAGEFLATFAGMYRFERARAARLPGEMLALFDLALLADRWLDELSPAQRARLSLARALLADPRLLLLDRPFDHFAQEEEEPAGDAEFEMQSVLAEIIRELAGMGKIVIIHTASPGRLADLAGRAAVLEDGVLLEEQTVGRIALRLGRQTFVRIEPVAPRQLPLAAYLLGRTQGFSDLRRVGGELIAAYDGPLQHAQRRIESKLEAAKIPLRRVRERRVRPSRLVYEP